MGFFDEIKKVLFGVKSVSKSAAGKVVDKGRDVTERSGEYLERAKDKAEELGENFADKAEDVWDSAIDNVEHIGSKVKSKAGDLFEDAKEFTEGVGEKVLNRADDLFEDAKEIAEDVGEKVIDTAGKAFHKVKDIGDKFSDKVHDVSDDKEKASDGLNLDEPLIGHRKSSSNTDEIVQTIKDKSEEAATGLKSAVTVVGDKVHEIKSDIVEKAKDLTDKLSNKLDETIKKAETLSAHEANQPEYPEPNENLRKSALDKDDFFKKAEAFADGRYDEVRDPFSTKPKIVGKVDKPTLPNKSSTPIPGFEDLDGDGDELIDDALLDSDDKE
jgi:ElaB/YqjD/DUF883 family membrane-anchored ribosome-binding protein